MKIEKSAVSDGALTSDNSPTLCRGDDNASSVSETKLHFGDGSLRSDKDAWLPREARLPINRCNLPAVVLGGLTYQQHPSPLLIDGVAELHADLSVA